MDVMELRRGLMAIGTGTLPSAYWKVSYIARDASYAGPYLSINFPVVTNDVISATVENTAPSGEQAFIGTVGEFEFYYNNSLLRTWRDSTISKIVETYGPPDVVSGRVLVDNKTINLIGAYNTTGPYKFNGRIYSVTITDANGNMKLNLIPCIRKSDGVPGMFDIVSKTFYTNSGNGEWIVPT